MRTSHGRALSGALSSVLGVLGVLGLTACPSQTPPSGQTPTSATESSPDRSPDPAQAGAPTIEDTRVHSTLVISAKLRGKTSYDLYAVRDDGSPSDVLRDRLDEGIALYRAGRVKRLLVSGDHKATTYDEPNAMRRYLEANGIPPEAIFMDHGKRGLTRLDHGTAIQQPVAEIRPAVPGTADGGTGSRGGSIHDGDPQQLMD